jgi:hypothetical protein
MLARGDSALNLPALHLRCPHSNAAPRDNSRHPHPGHGVIGILLLLLLLFLRGPRRPPAWVFARYRCVCNVPPMDG